MRHIITPDPINAYAELYTTPESDTLHSLNQETHANVRGAQMISGHLQGAFLQLLSQMVRPRRILELGTYTGYSAIALAKGLAEGGLLHTIDIDGDLQGMRDAYWEQSGLKHLIHQHIGPAAQIVPEIEGPFDLVFIDADKKNYGLYYDLTIDRMPSGGILIADNVLFRGEVILPEDQRSPTANYMHQFNIKVSEDPRVEQVLLPIRDGLMLVRKK